MERLKGSKESIGFNLDEIKRFAPDDAVAFRVIGGMWIDYLIPHVGIDGKKSYAILPDSGWLDINSGEELNK